MTQDLFKQDTVLDNMSRLEPRFGEGTESERSERSRSEAKRNDRNEAKRREHSTLQNQIPVFKKEPVPAGTIPAGIQERSDGTEGCGAVPIGKLGIPISIPITFIYKMENWKLE